MAIWEFSDGATLHTGGAVSGDSRAAERLRELLAAHPATQLHVYPQPVQRTAPLDRDSDFLLDALAREVAAELGVHVATSYEPTVDDAPPELRAELLEFCGVGQHSPYGTVY